MRGLAASARLQGQYKSAIRHLERVLEISKEMNEFTGVCVCVCVYMYIYVCVRHVLCLCVGRGGAHLLHVLLPGSTRWHT